MQDVPEPTCLQSASRMADRRFCMLNNLFQKSSVLLPKHQPFSTAATGGTGRHPSEKMNPLGRTLQLWTLNNVFSDNQKKVQNVFECYWLCSFWFFPQPILVNKLKKEVHLFENSHDWDKTCHNTNTKCFTLWFWLLLHFCVIHTAPDFFLMLCTHSKALYFISLS